MVMFAGWTDTKAHADLSALRSLIDGVFVGAVYEVKRGGLTGDGTTDERTALMALDVTAQATGTSLLFSPGTYYVSANTTITSPVIMLPGANIKMEAGAKLTFTKNFDAKLHRCFTWVAATAWATATVYAVGALVSKNGINYRCLSAHTSDATTEPGLGTTGGTILTGTISWHTTWEIAQPAVFTNGAVDCVRPEWWGAVGNSSTPCRVAFVLAARAALNGFYPVHVQLSGGGYDIHAADGYIEVPGGVIFKGIGMTRYTGTRIRHQSGDLGFALSGVDEGGAFQGGGFENITFDRGPGGDGRAIRCRRAVTRYEWLGANEWFGHTFLELDNAKSGNVAHGNPFRTTLREVHIWGFSADSISLVQYGVRAIENFNGSKISSGSFLGASVAAIAIEHASVYTIEDVDLETNISGAATGVGLLIGAGAAGRIPEAGEIRGVYGERNDYATIKVVRCRGLLIDNPHTDGLSGSIDNPNQFGIAIVGAAGGAIDGVKIRGGDMRRSVQADIYIEEASDVEIDCGNLASTVPILLGANGSYHRKMPYFTGAIGNTAVHELTAANLGRLSDNLISVSVGNGTFFGTFFLRGGSGDGAQELTDANNNFATVKDTPGMINIYRDTDGKHYLQNLNGSTRSFCIRVLHHHTLS